MFKGELKQAKGEAFALQVFIGFVTFAIQRCDLVYEFFWIRHGWV